MLHPNTLRLGAYLQSTARGAVIASVDRFLATPQPAAQHTPPEPEPEREAAPDVFDRAMGAELPLVAPIAPAPHVDDSAPDDFDRAVAAMTAAEIDAHELVAEPAPPWGVR